MKRQKRNGDRHIAGVDIERIMREAPPALVPRIERLRAEARAKQHVPLPAMTAT